MFLALETEHFTVYREVGLPPACGELGTDLEGYYSGFSTYLNIGLPPGRKLTYKHFTTIGAARGDCEGGTGNCYFPATDTITSLSPANPHEIAHAFETRIGVSGDKPHFFSEGVASVLGDGFEYDRPDHRVDSSLSVEDLVDDAAFSAYAAANGRGVLYSTAAGFVRHLIDSFGKDSFLAFDARLNGVKTGTAVKTAFLSTFGLAFDPVVQAWRAGAQPLVEDLLVATPDCNLPAAIGSGDSVTLDPQCDRVRTRFDVPTTGRLDVSVVNALSGGAFPPASVEFRSCDHGLLIPESGGGVFVTSPIRFAFDVPPGTYEAIVSGGPVSVAIALDTVTLDQDGACSMVRVAAAFGDSQNSQFGVIRRWGNLERQVSFDIAPQSAGLLQFVSVSGDNAGSPNSTTPKTLSLCPNSCPVDVSQNCASDDILSPEGTVVGKPVNPADLLHFETGPRSGFDWSYSLRMYVSQGP